MTAKENKQGFIDSARDFINSVWVKRANPMHPGSEPNYPGAVTEIIESVIDGEEMIFFVRITASSKYDLLRSSSHSLRTRFPL